MAEQQKRLNTFISAAAFKRVKLWAAEHDMTLGDAVDDLLIRGFGGTPVVVEPKQEAGLSPEKKSWDYRGQVETANGFQYSSYTRSS